jgi:hypothetical protein
VAELADAQDSGSCGRKVVEVQLLSPALLSIQFTALVAVTYLIVVQAFTLNSLTHVPAVSVTLLDT